MKLSTTINQLRYTYFLCFVLFFSFACSSENTNNSNINNSSNNTPALRELCINLGKSGSVPPAGVQINFTVNLCTGEPLDKRLQETDFTIINDETGKPFASEGKGVSKPRPPNNINLSTILVLDMSESIFANQVVDNVIAGANNFIKQMVEEQESNFKHKVAIYAFGSTVRSKMILDFTSDHQRLYSALSQLKKDGSRGGTNLYGAFTSALNSLSDRDDKLSGLKSSSMIILTDGTHEAGNTEKLREEALKLLQSKSLKGINVFSIGVNGDYDQSKIEELASRKQYFYKDDAKAISTVFEKIANRLQALSDINYVIGICTPIESSVKNPSVTIVAKYNDLEARLQVKYSTFGLTGDISRCDPEQVAKSSISSNSTQPGTGTTGKTFIRLTLDKKSCNTSVFRDIEGYITGVDTYFSSRKIYLSVGGSDVIEVPKSGLYRVVFQYFVGFIATRTWDFTLYVLPGTTKQSLLTCR